MHLEKYAGDDTLFDFDCTNILAAGETIVAGSVVMSALPDFAAEDPALLIFGDPLVNVDAITFPDGRVMAIGKGFQVRISAGTSASEVNKRIYAVLGTFTTSESNDLTTKAPLWLLAPGYAST